MQVQGELRGHLGWQRDIIQPWGHDRCGAIAVKRRGRRPSGQAGGADIGSHFPIREGGKTVGSGVVTKILE